MSEEKPTAAGAALAVERASRRELEVGPQGAMTKTLDDQLQFARWALESRLLPDAITTVAQAWVVMQRGAELGFPGLSAFEVLYVVQGRVRLTPDGAKAKALASGLLEDALEEVVGEGDQMFARVTVKRRGLPTPVVGLFSVADAKVARLWGKVGAKGPSSWVTHPKRMLLARARGFAYGDAFRDVIGGLQVREVFDLDPGETIGPPLAKLHPDQAGAAPSPPPPDPLLEELSGKPAAPRSEPALDPPPFKSHAEADAEIIANEGQGDLFR